MRERPNSGYEVNAYKAITSLVTEADAIQDLVHEAMVKISQSKASYHGGAAWNTWVYAIARNVAIDWLRKQQTREQIHLEAEEKPNPDVYQQVEQSELAAVLSTAIKQLRNGERALLLLANAEVPHEDIGLMLGIHKSCVLSSILRARRKVREMVEV